MPDAGATINQDQVVIWGKHEAGLVFAPDNNPIRSIGNFKFSVDLLAYTGHLFRKNVFTMKSTEDLKSKYKPGSGCYLGQTLGRSEATK